MRKWTTLINDTAKVCICSFVLCLGVWSLLEFYYRHSPQWHYVHYLSHQLLVNKWTLMTRTIRPGLHQRQKRRIPNAAVGTRVSDCLHQRFSSSVLCFFMPPYSQPNTVTRRLGRWCKRYHWLVWYLSDGVRNARRWKRGQCALAPPDAFDVIVLINSSVFVQRWCNPGLRNIRSTNPRGCTRM
jgi:hypothetical protein